MRDNHISVWFIWAPYWKSYFNITINLMIEWLESSHLYSIVISLLEASDTYSPYNALISALSCNHHWCTNSAAVYWRLVMRLVITKKVNINHISHLDTIVVITQKVNIKHISQLDMIVVITKKVNKNIFLTYI